MKHFVTGIGIMTAVLTGSASFGAGLWLYEGGTPDVGAAIAGRAALASDASTASANPAGMTQLDRSQMLVALQGLYLNAKFDTELSAFGGGNGGNAGGFIPSGGFHYAHRINEDVSVGLSLGSYFGLGVDYASDWAGRYYITEADLITFGVNPGIGYRVNDWLSVGAGFSVMYAELSQKVAINNAAATAQPGVPDGELVLEDDDVAYGFNLGLLVEPRSGTRIGLTYRSEIDLEFRNVASARDVALPLQGLLAMSGLAGSQVDLNMTVPQAIMLSAYQELTSRWAIMGNIGWQEWSKFGKQEIGLRSTESRSFTQDLDYDDTWHFALGAQYRIAPDWLWSFGIAYDTSPVDNDQGRTPDLALDRQIRFATGLQYDLSEDVTIGGVYQYIDLGSGGIDRNDGPLKGPLKGDYSSNEIHVFALNLIWRL
ncbi:MAG TPA: outer membrane protein transport protein [Kiritimatiellia bacterium]|nr:outer membrane protein transport protein [Kiritimatiellia bacterium]